ncbi:hypothetical protein [Gandjariella thermophila]|uniref:Uncharacterized protein n=1 Tax=Gandjariella thermophila TaxID=1931992 RepID=A0A4D4J8T1_9PSEU|nr:hypothetical protein [Gandjariella thermophila]GDY31642.1 hypothetical protein GTS_32750 [Gandjariella thermophila]
MTGAVTTGYIDHSGEPLRPDDLAEVARVWRDYRRVHYLATPVAAPGPG